ncbi:hypothetical protein X739_16940 [Mesorhizobium sp. LNHC220B00]|jgi:hypothetical protein|nr:hypothetical protein X739_16940 [Mesorhizobium sp. LNHC220B00]ESY97641.1 hypothetical protein X741_02680 [Mesorhizobium sp. LNHC229A00]ESZ01857.1 hypothetical protein X738_00770 [Mesorhizobium sp. LNHC209A00]
MFSLAMIYAFSLWDSNTTATEFMKGRRMSRIFADAARYQTAHVKPESSF